jgi:predicted Holliday junction resolvase-like endonuclease
MDLLTIVLMLIIGIIALILGLFIGFLLLKNKFEKKLDAILKTEREDAIKRSRSVLTGQFSEQISPYMPGFPYSPTECKFLGKPIDFIVFKGADSNNIEEVIFLEIKSCDAKLNKQEKNLKKTILQKKVKWDEYKAK